MRFSETEIMSFRVFQERKGLMDGRGLKTYFFDDVFKNFAVFFSVIQFAFDLFFPFVVDAMIDGFAIDFGLSHHIVLFTIEKKLSFVLPFGRGELIF